MGVYGEQVVPRIINLACGLPSNDKLRQRVCAGLSGEVLEIGFGSGLNVPFYPDEVRRVDAVEPADLGWKLAQKRLAASSVPVQRSGLDGQSLPFADASHDFAISTWTLCSIPDAAAALREVRRVLKPGGSLHFVEHGLRRTRACGVGSAESSRFRSGCSVGVTSPGRSRRCWRPRAFRLPRSTPSTNPVHRRHSAP